MFSVFGEIKKDMGGLDVLAHVAGIESLKSAEDYTPKDIEFMWGVNINGTIYTNQAACKIMKEQLLTLLLMLHSLDNLMVLFMLRQKELFFHGHVLLHMSGQSNTIFVVTVSIQQ